MSKRPAKKPRVAGWMEARSAERAKAIPREIVKIRLVVRAALKPVKQ